MELAKVWVRACACPDQPHEDGHHVFMAPTIGLEGGIAAERAMLEVAVQDHKNEADRIRALTYAWAPVFVRYGAKDWDLCDEQGEPIPFDMDALLADYSMARLVANHAGELGYGSAVMAPFQMTPEKPSRNGRTLVTTSARPRRTRE